MSLVRRCAAGFLVITFSALETGTVFAETSTTSSSTVQLTPTVINGQVCLPPAQSEKLLFILEHTLPEFKAEVEAQDHLIEAQKLVTQTATEAEAAAIDLSAQQKARADDLEKALKKDDSEINAWYRSPYLWAGVGVVGTFGVILAVKLILGSLGASTITIGH